MFPPVWKERQNMDKYTRPTPKLFNTCQKHFRPAGTNRGFSAIALACWSLTNVSHQLFLMVSSHHQLRLDPLWRLCSLRCLGPCAGAFGAPKRMPKSCISASPCSWLWCFLCKWLCCTVVLRPQPTEEHKNNLATLLKFEKKCQLFGFSGDVSETTEVDSPTIAYLSRERHATIKERLEDHSSFQHQ